MPATDFKCTTTACRFSHEQPTLLGIDGPWWNTRLNQYMVQQGYSAPKEARQTQRGEKTNRSAERNIPTSPLGSTDRSTDTYRRPRAQEQPTPSTNNEMMQQFMAMMQQNQEFQTKMIQRMDAQTTPQTPIQDYATMAAKATGEYSDHIRSSLGMPSLGIPHGPNESHNTLAHLTSVEHNIEPSPSTRIFAPALTPKTTDQQRSNATFSVPIDANPQPRPDQTSHPQPMPTSMSNKEKVLQRIKERSRQAQQSQTREQLQTYPQEKLDGHFLSQLQELCPTISAQSCQELLHARTNMTPPSAEVIGELVKGLQLGTIDQTQLPGYNNEVQITKYISTYNPQRMVIMPSKWDHNGKDITRDDPGYNAFLQQLVQSTMDLHDAISLDKNDQVGRLCPMCMYPWNELDPDFAVKMAGTTSGSSKNGRSAGELVLTHKKCAAFAPNKGFISLTGKTPTELISPGENAAQIELMRTRFVSGNPDKSSKDAAKKDSKQTPIKATNLHKKPMDAAVTRKLVLEPGNATPKQSTQQKKTTKRKKAPGAAKQADHPPKVTRSNSATSVHTDNGHDSDAGISTAQGTEPQDMDSV